MMDYVFYVAIIICALVIYKSPQTFMGRAKYDENAVKTQGLIKKGAIAIIVFHLILILLKAFR